MVKAKDYGNFTLLGSDDTYRMIVRSWGRDKTGKNHFGFTGPGPVFGQYFDPGGAEGVVEKFRRGGKDVYAVHYRFKKGEMGRTQAIEIRDQFIKDYEFALKNARTIQWDESEVWELFRWAEFDDESDAPRFYGPLDARYRELLQLAYDSGANLQLIQKVKERWTQTAKGAPVPSGVFEPTGFKGGANIVQANLEHLWDKERGFVVNVVNCRQNMDVAGQEFTGLDFPTLGQLVFPDSDESDWS